VAIVHLYGSNLESGYFLSAHEIIHPLPNNIHNTTYRIETATNYYMKTFQRIPSSIIINTVSWDLQGMYQNSFQISDFESNLLCLLRLISKIVGYEVPMGFRTSPVGEKGHNADSVTLMNDVIRKLYLEGKCNVLYDYDRDMWSIFNFERYPDNCALMFQDKVHPNSYFTKQAAEKMLGRLYSNYYFSRSIPVSYYAGDKIINNNNVNVRFIKSNSTQIIYYTTYINNLRLKWTLNAQFETLSRWLFMSKGDILTLDSKVINTIPTLDMPNVFDERRYSVTTRQNINYLITPNERFEVFEVTNDLAFLIFQVPSSNYFTEIDDFWFKEDLFRKGDRIENIYQDHTLLRYYNDKRVYVVLNKTKWGIPNVYSLISHGYDLENVIVLREKLFLEVLPYSGHLV
jgi:hypothetical protein